MVFITDKVRVKDWTAFKRAGEEILDKARERGCLSLQIYRKEGDPNQVEIAQRWPSHEAMHKFEDEVGEEFNRKAGLSGDDWETEVWEESDAAASEVDRRWKPDRQSGKFLSITLWETEADLRASEAAANRLRAQAAQAAATQPPTVEIYEVAVQV